MSASVIISLILVAIINISLIVYYLSHLKLVNPYLRYAAAFALLLMILDVAYLSSTWSEIKDTGITALVVATVFNYIKITIYAGVGIFCCAQLNIKAVPLLERLYGSGEREALDFRKYFTDMALVVSGFVIFSYVFLKLTAPNVSEIVKGRFTGGTQINLPTILFVISFAYTEEVFYRMAAQNFLARAFRLEGWKYWIAIVLSTAMWTLAHSGTLDPEWIKYVQVLPLGIALGYFYRKHGVEFCIFTHMLVNIIMAFLGKYLFV